MKNKRNKLQIKENWSKALTISPSNLQNIKGRGDLSVPKLSVCPACEDCNPQTNKATDPTKPPTNTQ